MSRLLIPVVCLLAIVAAACGEGAQYDVPAGRVQVVENGTVLGELPRAEAIDDLASRIGFEVTQPAYLPDGGFRLVAVEAQLPNPIEALGDDGRSNAVGVLLWMDGRGEDDDTSRIYLIQYSRSAEPPVGLEQVDSGTEGASFYWLETPNSRDAAWITSDRAFTLETSGPDAPGQDEVRKLFQSMR